MFHLTREVRFAANEAADPQLLGKPTNSYAGFPTPIEFAPWLAMQVTVAGKLEAQSNYLVNIKQIDAAVREHAIPIVNRAVAPSSRQTPERAVIDVFSRLRGLWPSLTLERVRLLMSPFLSVSVAEREFPMVQLSQKFEFSATHRLHNAALSEPENQRVYGKCNNPHGHGHNYEVQVTLSGNPGQTGTLIDLPAFERIVAATVIDRFDHKNLNAELPEFRELIPTVENIAMTIFRLLKPRFGDQGAKLASVMVWETPKTWCEYSE